VVIDEMLEEVAEIIYNARAGMEHTWTPYAELPDGQKEPYRWWARKVLRVFREWLERGYFYDGKDESGSGGGDRQAVRALSPLDGDGRLDDDGDQHDGAVRAG